MGKNVKLDRMELRLGRALSWISKGYRLNNPRCLFFNNLLIVTIHLDINRDPMRMIFFVNITPCVPKNSHHHLPTDNGFEFF